MSDRPPNLNDLCDGDPLARALANLRPTTPPIDMNAMMFAAGRASCTASLRRWQRTCVSLGLLLVGSWVAVYSWDSGEPRPLVDSAKKATPHSFATPAIIIGQEEPMSVPPATAEPQQLYAEDVAASVDGYSDYLRIRQNIMIAGLNGLPESAPPPPPGNAFDFQRSLHMPLDVLASPYYSPLERRVDDK